MIGGINYIDIFGIKKKIPNFKNFFYINGRIAFREILNTINNKRYKKIYIPNYICESLIDNIPEKKFVINFYNVNDNLDIKLPHTKNSIILIINYFGKTFKIPSKIKKNNIIIEDKTFSYERFIKKKKKKEYYFASLRKIYPSLIHSISNLKNNKKKISSNKILSLYKKCLVGSFLKQSYNKSNFYVSNKKIEKEYLNKIQLIENFFNINIYNFEINNIFLNYYSSIAFRKNKKILKRNKEYLIKSLSNLKKINFINDDRILYLLIFSKQKRKLINFAKKRKIYISDYWKKPKLLLNKKISHNLYENLILIPNNYNYLNKELEIIKKNIRLFFKQ